MAISLTAASGAWILTPVVAQSGFSHENEQGSGLPCAQAQCRTLLLCGYRSLSLISVSAR
jgi:hypothetical protein